MGRRFPSLIHGLYVIDKPVGPTSMDVVRRVRRAAGGCKCGHGGTLDPLASGVVVCALGKATKAVEGLMDHAKIYEATVDLSAFTVTDDAEGAREEVTIPEAPDLSAIRSCLASLSGGEIMQLPPVYSALKIGGQPAYERARRGEDVRLAPRPVRIDTIDLLDYAWPLLGIRVHCGRGTYIRSLARQIGEGLGCGGHLRALRRLAVGRFTVAGATPLDELPAHIGQDDLLFQLG